MIKSKEVYKLPPEKAVAAQKISIPCVEAHHVDPNILAKLMSGTLPHDDEAIKKYLYCFTLKAGFIEEDGHIVVDKLATLLGNHPLLEEFKEALRNCNKITKENHLETVIEMNACIRRTAPVIFTL
ncbi:uncharacterized protein [Epargyreus clarus]|uniref:uncharacterized protein n=1 Tax=Epargyreus clarus TaxID=520877 RepID=UPI003C2DDEBC